MFDELGVELIDSSTFIFFSTFHMDQLGKILRHHWKERLKISIFAKFESDLSKPNEYIVPQSREILPTFIWRGAQFCPPPYQRL